MGDLTYDADLKGYYYWNAAWGYMRFPRKFNFDLNDVLDVGLYYAHGRWYNQDTGLWLSPNQKGEYGYEPQPDPVNRSQSVPCTNFEAPTLTPMGSGIVDWIKSPNVEPVTFPTGEAETILGLKNDILASARRHNTPKTKLLPSGRSYQPRPDAPSKHVRGACAAYYSIL